MTLQELLIGQFGVSATDINETTVTVGATPTQLLQNNPNRIGVLISNLGSNTIYIGFNSAVSQTTGAAVGGSNSYGAKWRDDFNTVGYARYAVSPGGSSTVYVAEIVMTGNEQPTTGNARATT